MEQNNAMVQKPGTGWLIAGYIFALLGGLLGVIIGAHLAFSKIISADGQKIPRYVTSTKNQGIVIFLIAIVSMIVWNIVIRM